MKKLWFYTFIICLLIAAGETHARSNIKSNIFTSINIGSTKMDQVGIDNALENFIGTKKQSQNSILPNNIIEDINSSYGLNFDIVKIGITKIIGVELNKPIRFGHYRTFKFEYKSGASKYYLPSGINMFSDPTSVDLKYNGLSFLISERFINESFKSAWPFIEAGGNLSLASVSTNVSSNLLDIDTNEFVFLKSIFTNFGIKYGKKKNLSSFISYKKFDDNYTEIEFTTSFSINW